MKRIFLVPFSFSLLSIGCFRNFIPQADQRKGRTGRTCDGHVYRLVTGAFFNQLEDYEPPAIQRLSLKKQILLLLCAESKAINDPRGTCYFFFCPLFLLYNKFSFYLKFSLKMESHPSPLL